MAKSTKRNWFEAGLAILVEEGASNLTIDALLGRMGKTKGSFYHHFKGIGDYVSQYLDFFEQEGTLDIITICNQEPTPHQRLTKLLEISTSYPAQIEVAMRAWAAQDERVKAVYERVDARRLGYLVEQFRPIIQDEAETVAMSRACYAILIGGEHMQPPMQGADHRAMFGALINRYGFDIK